MKKHVFQTYWRFKHLGEFDSETPARYVFVRTGGNSGLPRYEAVDKAKAVIIETDNPSETVRKYEAVYDQNWATKNGRDRELLHVQQRLNGIEKTLKRDALFAAGWKGDTHV